MSPVSPVFHTVVTAILTLEVSFSSWGKSSKDPNSRPGNPDPYPLHQRRTDLDTLVVLSTLQFRYMYRQSPIFSLVTNTQLSSLNANIWSSGGMSWTLSLLDKLDFYLSFTSCKSWNYSMYRSDLGLGEGPFIR